MIDQKVFRAEWAIMEARFGKDFPAPVVARYYQILSPVLDTATFREACVRVFRGTYFPSPDEFLAGAVPDPQEEALDQWDLCQRIMEGERQVLDRMTERGRRTIALLGGPALLGQTPVDRVGWVRKEFLATYRELVGGPPGARAIPCPEVTPESRRIAGIVMGDGGEH